MSLHIMRLIKLCNPTTMEALLEKQWDQSADFLMNQASSSSHLDIASLLSCLHQIREENFGSSTSALLQRRDHLVTVNTRLAHPLTHNAMHNAQLGMAAGGDANARSRSPRYNNVLHSQRFEQQSQQLKPVRTLCSFAPVPQPVFQFQLRLSPLESPPTGTYPIPHNLARNHAASPSTSSSSNLYHAHFASSTNQNHSSGAVTTHQNATGPQQGKNTSPSFANSVMQPSGHGPHPGGVKGTDRSSGGGSYRQYVGAAHTGGDLHGVKASHMTSEQHHRLFSQNKQGTGQNSATGQSSLHSHGSGHVGGGRAVQGSSQGRKTPSHGRSTTPRKEEETRGEQHQQYQKDGVHNCIEWRSKVIQGHQSESEARADLTRQVSVAQSMQNQTVIPLTVLTSHQLPGATIMPPNMTPQQHHVYQMMLPHASHGEMNKAKTMVSHSEGGQGQQQARNKSPRGEKKQNGTDKS
ncbi:hypothetical protein BSL78_09239 [Apostichopus japonicus]|uniref:Uncharacterized protein n=1 Tax=Stichopus japonicus TaxID=307972 RepID=A0A2G8L0R4_STIJA|nr:hypothetical protein BSL78_09239 [Apostichopus japonicus]